MDFEPVKKDDSKEVSPESRLLGLKFDDICRKYGLSQRERSLVNRFFIDLHAIEDGGDRPPIDDDEKKGPINSEGWVNSVMDITALYVSTTRAMVDKRNSN